MSVMLRIAVALLRKSKQRLVDGHPSRCLSERWRWSDSGNANGRKHRKKQPRLSGQAKGLMASGVAWAGGGMLVNGLVIRAAIVRTRETRALEQDEGRL